MSQFSLEYFCEPLMEDPSYFSKRMFGGLAVYYRDREWRDQTFAFDLWNGVLVCTSREHHEGLVGRCPSLRSHPVLGKWLYLPMFEATFESEFETLVELTQKGNAGIGIVPGQKKRKKSKKKKVTQGKSALIIGGNRFFGKALAKLLLKDGYNLTLAHRGNVDDGLGEEVERLVCDRGDSEKLSSLVEERSFDVVFDQVCYDYDTSIAASEVFKGKVGRYIFTSSQSVYKAGADLSESDFKVENHSFRQKHTADSDYAEAKRQAERGFFEKADFPTVFARLSIVLGPEDPTGRLKFHMDQLKRKEPVYFPDPDARLSMIHSDLAAQSLKKLGESDITGPVNVTCDEPIALRYFVAELEKVCGTPLKIANQGTEKNHSPYGISSDWYMNTSRLTGVCGPLPPVRSWLTDLIRYFHQRPEESSGADNYRR